MGRKSGFGLKKTFRQPLQHARRGRRGEDAEEGIDKEEGEEEMDEE